jgi:prepilin-type N-terminal cleavage/methylation domain-containing protein
MSGMKFNNLSSGFTLIEVLVTTTVMAISLVMIMKLFSIGLRVSRTSCDYTTAIVHARDKMEELSLDPVGDSGKFEDGFEWVSEVRSYDEHNIELEDTGLNLLELSVKISWDVFPDKKRAVSMVSLKMVESDEE